MSMAERAILLVVACLVAACGAPYGPDTGPPNRPTAALNAWKDFPAGAQPRPIVWLVNPGPANGFSTDGGKFAAICGRYAPADGFNPSNIPATSAAVTWPSGDRTSYPAISPRDAITGLSLLPGDQKNPQCTSVAPLRLTSARLGEAGIGTDRGNARVTAWIFTATGVIGELAYPALAPSAFWRGGMVKQGNSAGASVGADGLVLTYSFVGAAPTGPCGADYVSSVAESISAVAVAIKAIPHAAEGNVNCDAVGYPRTVDVHLASPLGGRVVLDSDGGALIACAAGPKLITPPGGRPPC